MPIRLTVSDYSVDGKTPVVFDGSKVMERVLDSPIFHTSTYGDGDRQFGDAMLRMEFPTAPASWSLTLSPSVGPVLDIVAPPGTVRVFKSNSGSLLAVVDDDTVIDGPIGKMLGAPGFTYDKYVVFISSNALEHDAFGYHGAVFLSHRSEEHVYAYNSWLEGVGDLFSIPSPDAATLSHEVAETIHDAFFGPLVSSTLLWGDAFGGNRCFQKFIEVGDAIEDAPGPVQLYKQPVQIGGLQRVYTLQNEALLPWFERQRPSTAMSGAYSFPSTSALTSPAPLTCRTH